MKHYKEAQHKYHLCERLDKKAGEKYPELWRTAQDNLMLYAEHTWGHSSTITNPYDTMVLNLDIRKNSYASKTHEASAKIMNRIMKEKGDLLRYYNTSGKIRVYPTAKTEGPQAVEFYIETLNMPTAEVRDSEGNVLTCQVSEHPRGRRISFVDTFKPGEPKEYTYARKEAVPEKMNTRQCYMGAERVRDNGTKHPRSTCETVLCKAGGHCCRRARTGLYYSASAVYHAGQHPHRGYSEIL